jgi:hypothetical protein
MHMLMAMAVQMHSGWDYKVELELNLIVASDFDSL